MIHRHNGKSHEGAAVVLNRLGAPSPVPVRAAPADVRARVETWIAEHPVACIAAALTLGAARGWLIKRR